VFEHHTKTVSVVGLSQNYIFTASEDGFNFLMTKTGKVVINFIKNNKVIKVKIVDLKNASGELTGDLLILMIDLIGNLEV